MDAGPFRQLSVSRSSYSIPKGSKGPECDVLWMTWARISCVSCATSLLVVPCCVKDGRGGHNDVLKCGYTRRKTLLSSSPRPAHVPTPGAHRVASLVKRWSLATHLGSVTADPVARHLEELAFRFNPRTSQSHGPVFSRLLKQTVVPEPVTEGTVRHGDER